MEIENSTILGTAMITFTSLLGAYYLILRIREFHREKPDPKLTYVTHAQMEKVRSEMMRAISEAVQDLRALRAEIREDTRALQKQYSRALSDNRDLIGKNAQNISALIAQSQTASQRISELSLKTDRIVMRLKEDM
jgi:septal ring factor EnvC (AmiA/AmiB activator)